MPTFISRLCDAVLAPPVADARVRNEIGRTIADTVAVAAAGFAEAVSQRASAAYGGEGPRAWNGARMESGDAAVMINAIAAHALDFDDVYLDSGSHSSTVIVPAALALDDPREPERIIDACAAGLIAARGVGRLLGRGHYRHGWHATGTVGVFSAAAAAGSLAGLSERQLRHAFGLAAAAAGGLQLNFSTMAKPAHAGFAASAGVRAVRLAAAGVDASEDIFGPGGVPDLYQGDAGELDDDAFGLRPDRVAMKLYPSCYATARLIGAALDLRARTGPIFAQPDVTVRLTTPAGSLRVLAFDRPVDGLQAKFSATYPVAVALIDGPPKIGHFTAEEIARPDLQAMMGRLIVVEDDSRFYDGNLETGSVTIEALVDGKPIAVVERSALPGSDVDRVTRDQVAAKAEGCFEAYRAAFGADLPILERVRRISDVAFWLD